MAHAVSGGITMLSEDYRSAAGTRATSRRTLTCPCLPEGRVAGVAMTDFPEN